jgi:predicted metal-dependent enzyme (double-stranded beta helix superfamily)
MHETSDVAAFMAEARALLSAGVTHEALDAVGRRLAETGLQKRIVAAGEMRNMHGGDSEFIVLQTDPDGLTLVLGRFSAREETPVHDHDSWGVACVVEGRDRYRHWHLEAAGGLSLLYEKELGPGSYVTWLDPPHDIHSQQGIGEPAVELILFGKNVMTTPRHYYDLKTGAVRTALPE